jgi:hypothetical protein
LFVLSLFFCVVLVDHCLSFRYFSVSCLWTIVCLFVIFLCSVSEPLFVTTQRNNEKDKQWSTNTTRKNNEKTNNGPLTLRSKITKGQTMVHKHAIVCLFVIFLRSVSEPLFVLFVIFLCSVSGPFFVFSLFICVVFVDHCLSFRYFSVSDKQWSNNTTQKNNKRINNGPLTLHRKKTKSTNNGPQTRHRKITKRQKMVH